MTLAYTICKMPHNLDLCFPAGLQGPPSQVGAAYDMAADGNFGHSNVAVLGQLVHGESPTLSGILCYLQRGYIGIM